MAFLSLCRRRLLLSMLTFLSFPWGGLWAEEVGVLPAYTVESTRMDGSMFEVPLALSRLGIDQIQQASTQLALDEALQTVPGVFVLNPYNFAQDSRIAIRGFGAQSNFGIRGIRLVVDGIPATTPDGQGSVDGIDLGSAQSVEVLRGPSAALYGAASGGVILIESEVGPENPFMETRWTFGDYGLIQGQLKAGGQSGPLNFMIHLTDLEYRGYRANSELENRRLNAKFTYDLNEHSELTALINLIDLPLQNDPGGLNAAQVGQDRRQARPQNLQYDAGEAVEQGQFGLSYRHRLNDAQAIELKSYYVHRNFENKLPILNGGQVAFERDFYGLGALYRYQDDGTGLVLGLDFDRQVDARVRYDNLNGGRGALTLDQDETVAAVGAFVTGRRDLAANWSVSASLRHDWIEFSADDTFLADGDDSGDRLFEKTSPMLGLSWEFAPGWALFGNVATSFETPTTTELANPAGGGFNPNVDPQTAVNFELGIKGEQRVFDSRELRYELTAFQIDIEDELVVYSLGGRDYFRNAGESQRRGIEAALQIELSDRLELGLSYTWSDFQYETYLSAGNDYSGNSLPGIPEHFGNLQLNYATDGGVFLRWNTRLVGSLYADDANSEKVDRYAVSDFRAGFTFVSGAWTFEPFVGLNNVFDQSYSSNIRINAFGGRFYEPAPERNVYSGFRIRFDFD